MSDVADTSAHGWGSRCTRRRALLRRNARHRVVCRALALFATAVDAVEVLDTPIGRYLKCFEENAGGSRHDHDLLPLPFVKSSTWSVPLRTLPALKSLLFKLVNASSAGLNHLHGGSRRSECSGAPSKCQSSALTGICRRWWQLGIHLGQSAKRLTYDPEAYSNLVFRKSSSGARPLVAATVDVLEVCSTVDAQLHLPAELREIVENPTKLVTVADNKLSPDVVYTGGRRSEYVLLLRKEFRAGKITFQSNCKHAKQIFFLPKKSSDALREVWNGKGLSAATVQSPLPPWLSSPSCLADLEASDDRPLLMSARDGACFFDQLRVPKDLQPYFGKPYVSCEELCRHGDNSVDFAPLLSAELERILGSADAVTIKGSTRVYPVSTCWPMGHCWSSAISQHVMTDCCVTAGVPADAFL